VQYGRSLRSLESRVWESRVLKKEKFKKGLKKESRVWESRVVKKEKLKKGLKDAN